MITVLPTTDRGYVLSILTDPELYGAISDDTCPKDPQTLAEAFMSPHVRHLQVLKDGEPVGLFSFVLDSSHFEMHTTLTEKCRGRSALDAGRKALQWALSQPECSKVKTNVLTDAPQALWYAHNLGFKEEGLPESRMRRGIPVGLVHLTLDSN